MKALDRFHLYIRNGILSLQRGEREPDAADDHLLNVAVVDADDLARLETTTDEQEKNLFRRAVRDGNLTNGFTQLRQDLDQIQSFIPEAHFYEGLRQATARAKDTLQKLAAL